MRVFGGLGRVTALLLLGLALAVPAPAAAERAAIRGVGDVVIPGWFKQSFLDLREDAREAAASGRHLLVYFGQPGCPYCAELFNNNFSQPHIVEYTRRHFDAVDFSMWGDREVTDFTGRTLTEKALAERLKVWFTPTLLFFDGQGRQVLRINGYYPPHRFLAALHYVAEKHSERLSLREYLARSAPPPAAGRLHHEPFFAKPPYDLSRSPAGRPVAVFFEQKDCEGCDRLHRNVFRQPATQEQVGRFHAVQLDRWSDTPVGRRRGSGPRRARGPTSSTSPTCPRPCCSTGTGR